METKSSNYETPQVEIMELEIEQAVLQASSFDPVPGNWPRNY